jgi:hypothetical protein
LNSSLAAGCGGRPGAQRAIGRELAHSPRGINLAFVEFETNSPDLRGVLSLPTGCDPVIELTGCEFDAQVGLRQQVALG